MVAPAATLTDTSSAPAAAVQADPVAGPPRVMVGQAAVGIILCCAERDQVSNMGRTEERDGGGLVVFSWK